MPKTASSRNRVRIIAGVWRGSRLDFPDVPGLRPTSDRTRETLFNWLQPEIHGSRCLDLFAGSGALGFEALSRGAAYALLLDKHKSAVHQLQLHKQRFNAQHCDIRQIDALTWLTQNRPSVTSTLPHQPGLERERAAFDIVFLDPPYAENLLPQCFQLIEQSGCIRDGGLLYYEQPIHTAISLSPRWRELRQKRSGQVKYSLLCFGDPA